MPAEARQALRIEEHPLSYLPRKAIVEYRRGQIVFAQNQYSDGLHMVVRGRVKCSVRTEDGSEVVLAMALRDQFFGERGLLGLPYNGVTATAIESSAVMSWSSAEIEQQIAMYPRLGVALMQMLARICVDFERRLQTLALEKTPERVAWAILYFVETMGTRQDDGWWQIPPMTHQLVSEFVGTSREIVTFQMTRLRDQGYLTYSRKSIRVDRDGLEQNLRHRMMVSAGLILP